MRLLLISPCLRRSPGSDRVALPEQRDGCGAIPRVIHHIWLGSPPPATVRARIATWRAAYPRRRGWRHALWRDADVDALGLRNRAAYDAAGNWGERSDIARCAVVLSSSALAPPPRAAPPQPRSFSCQATARVARGVQTMGALRLPHSMTRCDVPPSSVRPSPKSYEILLQFGGLYVDTDFDPVVAAAAADAEGECEEGDSGGAAATAAAAAADADADGAGRLPSRPVDPRAPLDALHRRGARVDFYAGLSHVGVVEVRHASSTASADRCATSPTLRRRDRPRARAGGGRARTLAGAARFEHRPVVVGPT